MVPSPVNHGTAAGYAGKVGDTRYMEMAWNGIRFSAPAAWEPAEIGPRYLLFEDDGRPILEIKWNPVRGKFSHKRSFRRLAAAHGRRLGKSLQKTPIPEAWQKVLPPCYETTAFDWNVGSTDGIGLILYCKACATASLIQFFQKTALLTSPVPVRLLSTFKDHAEAQTVRWSLFDIRAAIPDTFQLVDHRFTAGAFVLSFSGAGRKLNLNRWGPASVLLKGGNLEQFAGRCGYGRSSKPEDLSIGGCPTVQWTESLPDAWWARWYGRLKPKPSYLKARLWFLEKENRIFGVRFLGKCPLDTAVFNNICADYVAV